jgi:hypothetical protein
MTAHSASLLCRGVCTIQLLYDQTFSDELSDFVIYRAGSKIGEGKRIKEWERRRKSTSPIQWIQITCDLGQSE